MLRRNSRGDTLVEVLLASAILALVLAGTYSLSNRATRLNQSSYERSRASNLLQEQAELLRAARDEDGSTWTQILAISGNSPYYNCRDTANSVNPEDHVNTGSFNIFYLEADSGTIDVRSTSADRVKNTDNLYYTWVNRTSGPGDYHDFHIYTCWPGIGTIGDQVAGLAVRLTP